MALYLLRWLEFLSRLGELAMGVQSIAKALAAIPVSSDKKLSEMLMIDLSVEIRAV